MSETKYKMSGEEYSKRLRGFSDDTMLLISEIDNGPSKEKAIKSLEITANPDLTEEEIAQKLKELLASK